MYNPVSTYRIQFNKDFTFKKFIEHLDYFSMLGTGTIYAGPVFAAASGSMHGYNIVDPQKFNPEIGRAEEFNEIVDRLKSVGIGWLQDIVPNHMAFNKDNKWLMDVLEHGKYSKFAGYFDIDFSHPDFGEKLILPFLGKTEEDAAEQGEIRLSFRDDKFVFSYFDYTFPINEETLVTILQASVSSHLRFLSKKIGRHDHLAIQAHATDVIDAINADISKLKELLIMQHYKLCHWQEIKNHLNYRRFFTVTDLICLQMDKDDVFDEYHSLVYNLVKNRKLQGLRIDHIDGLRHPSKYIEKVHALSGEETYIVVEKILERNEELPHDWPVQGTSGYDFLVCVNNLLTYKKNYPALKKYYQELIGKKEEPEEIMYQKKRLILYRGMNGDLDNLCRLFILSDFFKPGEDPDITQETIKEAIGEFLIACPRYRLYSNSFPLSEEDKMIIKSIILRAGERVPHLIKPLKLLQNLMLDQTGFDEGKRDRALNFFLRCMQYTGPLMAKGIEDTAMYTYNCFIVHNEVGDSIDSSGISVKEFHEWMLQRQIRMPFSINATSTHDTKRGEDFRARLQVISELPDQWIEHVNLWTEVNRSFKLKINNSLTPDANEEYFIYQTLTGIYPFSGKTDDYLLKRINLYMIKALREAKINSDWETPDEDYEFAVCEFIRKILTLNRDFLNTFLPFQRKIADFGFINSLVQLTLKATCPGIPDFYQGTELWDFSMVDPDNRRPVDFGRMKKELGHLIEEQLNDTGDFVDNLYQKRENGQIKLWLSYLLIKERSLNRDLFIYGQYLPLEVSGKYRENILAFARVYLDTWYVVVVPLYIALLLEKRNKRNTPDRIEWGDTLINLPEKAPNDWKSVYGDSFKCENTILVSGILKLPFPLIMKGITIPFYPPV